jgi:type II secretory pathway component PulF
MTAAADPNLTFAYQAQTFDGKPMIGTLDAPHLDAAMHQLHSIGLRVMEIEPVTKPSIPKARTLRGDDFLAFNEQLAHLASAGMPIEQGLRLMAQDLKKGRLADTIRALAEEVDRGVPLEQAIQKHQTSFPPLYAKLVEAGARTGDLGTMLLSLGKHVETVQRLRRTLWRSVSYPLMVTIALAVVLLFLSLFVFPQFAQTYTVFGYGKPPPSPMMWWTRSAPPPAPPTLPLPPVTKALFVFGQVMPFVIGALLIFLIVWPAVWWVMRRTGADGAFTDRVLLRLPLIGRALRLNLLARWCDALRLAVVAGMDLPGAIKLAADTVHSPALQHDSHELISAMERGLPLEAANATAILPAVVPPMIELASRSADLPAAMETLSNMYQQQAEIRIRAIPMVLTPLLMFIVALLLGFVLTGLTMPMVRLLRYLSGGGL